LSFFDIFFFTNEVGSRIWNITVDKN